MPLTPLIGDLTVQEVSRRSGLTESALRYYERIGLIGPVPRDPSSGHRRYPPALVEAIESLSCLRSTGMSVRDMRAYVDNMARGVDAAGDQRQLFADHATRLADEIERLELRRRYVAAKARLWAAAAGQRYLAAARLVPPLRELTPLLGAPKAITNAKAITQLGWRPRSAADAVTATAESLLRLNPAVVADR